MKKTALFLYIILILFSSCTDENEFKQKNNLPEAPEGMVNMSLDLAPAGFDKPTKNRATLQDTDVKNAWAVVFENPTADSYSTDATVREIAEVTLAPDGRSGYAVMTASQRPTFILLIANTSLERSKLIASGLTYQQVINDALFYGDPARNGEEQLTIPRTSLLFSNETGELTTPIPMSGVSQILPKIEKGVKFNNAVRMARVINKLYVNATAANAKNGFVLSGISLLGTHITTPFDLAGTLGVKPTQRAPGTDLYQISGGVKEPILQNITDNTTKSASIDRPVYYYEPYKPFDIIVAGTPQGSSSVRYYKANVNVTTGGNASVVVNVQSVQNNGYATMDEAMAAPAGSGIVVEALILDESHEIIANGQYYMGLSNSEFQLYADGKQRGVTVATITTNAFNSGGTAPTTRIELVSGTNLSLVAGQTISSNSTDIKVDFNDAQTAAGTIRVTIGDLTRDILIKKDWAITGNFKTGDEGFLIASDIISAQAADNNPRIGLGTTQTSSERNQSLQSSAGTAGYLFIKNTIDEDILEVRALTATGKTILVRNMTNIPEFAGNNIYWDDVNDRPKFDNLETATNEGTLTVRGMLGQAIGSLILAPEGEYRQDLAYIKDPVGRTFSVFPSPSHIQIPESLIINSMIPMLPDRGFGDYCEFMTRRQITPNNKTGRKWKYPSQEEVARLPLRQKRVGTYTPAPVIDPNGTTKNDYYFNFADLFFFPQAETYYLNSNLIIKDGCMTIILNKMIIDLAGNNNFAWGAFSNMNNREKMQIISIDNFNNMNKSYGYSIRCVRDDSPGAIVPLYKVKYDLTPEPNETIRNQPTDIQLAKFVDQGDSFTLSNTKLTTTEAGEHTGWIVNGSEYALGATISGINSDITIKPKWDYIKLAGSNIYWDGTKLTFDDVPTTGYTPHAKYQGVYFRWGSLVAFSYVGSEGTFPGVKPLISYSPGNIAYSKLTDIPEIERDAKDYGSLDDVNIMLREHNPTASIGDICKYMTDKGWTPPGNWRVPTKAQLKILTTATLKKSGSWTTLSSYNTNGTTSLTGGAMTNRIFIPASAYKRVGNYYDIEEVGTRPDFNVSSSRGNNVPWSAYLINSDLTHYINYFSTSNDSWAFPVRCIRVD